MSFPQRRSIRLPDADYAAPGAYFVTICVQDKACIFGAIADGLMTVNAWGQVVVDCWQAIPKHFSQAVLDVFVVMPNHMHGIIVIDTIAEETKNVGAQHAAPFVHSDLRAQHAAPLRNSSLFPRVVPGSLGAIVRSFKSATTREINRLRQTPGGSLWQRNYHEHIIRNEEDLNRIRAYVESNPQRWADDKFYV